MAEPCSPFTIEIETPANGRVGKSTITVLDQDRKVIDTDQANLLNAKEREKAAKRLAVRLNRDEAQILKAIEQQWHGALSQYRRIRELAEAGSPEAAAVEHTELLDSTPLVICRPLCLVGGRAYAAAWLQMQRRKTRSVDPASGAVTTHDPPVVTIEDVLVLVTGDGILHADAALPGARSLAELGLPVQLPAALPPDRSWSGAGVKRFVAGQRVEPANVFERITDVVNSFVDFDRSLAPQGTMCELAACYILASYLLDAFNVIGYLWPNGERGTGKTTFLQVNTELGYLGQLILAGSSYACLRDLADYGALLAFDDAEGVMDIKRTDPDKRTLLLAGNRRGANIAVKELAADGKRWATRHVRTFCPRLFSAIRLPDDVLGSRSILVPLVRSGDPQRAKANPMNPEDWPHYRRQLVDDLWALGLTHLPELPAHDRLAARTSPLMGRDLDPWRAILAVAHWLEQRHGQEDLFARLSTLAVDYHQQERSDYEESDKTRVFFRVLLKESSNAGPTDLVEIVPGDVAQKMNAIAVEESLHDGDKPFTNARQVGWLLKRQRFPRDAKDRQAKTKVWKIKRDHIVKAANAFGVATEPARGPA